MSLFPELKLDWCSYEAAKYAVMHWNYSRSMPTPPLANVGVWERKMFIGALIFGRGNAPNLKIQYDLKTTEIAELVRVALCEHKSKTSHILSVGIKLFRKFNIGIRLLVAYSDCDQGHYGTLYQAGNWCYVGWTKGSDRYQDRTGRMWHSRMLSNTGKKKVYGKYRKVLKPNQLKRIKTKGRHKYLYALDTEIAKRIETMRQPYPKRVTSKDSVAPTVQVGERGANPTVTLACYETL